MKKVHKKRIRGLVVAISLFIAAAFLALLFFSVKKFFTESNLFLVRQIRTNLDEVIDPYKTNIKLPQGAINNKNLFLLDIKNISRTLEKKYPQYKNVFVRRQFPSTLFIEFVERLPFFQIDIRGDFWFVDDENIIISGPKPKPYPGLVAVYGLFPKSAVMSVGREISFSFSDRVNSLIKELKALGLLDNFKVTSLQAYSLNNIWFDLEGIKIKVGDTEYRKKLGLLERLILPRFKEDFDKIDYIDLRFKDYVVGYKR
ncbi:MAG: FtsQ-type POTRA domain-containing protein [Candidatus Omnitrophica bacterium]|nr:FtsQ-type POTRA domain-containing protein [Candidatus Omnitrophota bacterium]